MLALTTLLIASFLATVNACAGGTSGCTHPGNFLGEAYFPYPSIATSNNSCGITVTSGGVDALIPLSFSNPPDESPCGQTILAINVNDPNKKVTATIVGYCQPAYCGSSSIMLTPNGLGQLSPDGNPNEAPFAVNWTNTPLVASTGT